MGRAAADKLTAFEFSQGGHGLVIRRQVTVCDHERLHFAEGHAGTRGGHVVAPSASRSGRITARGRKRPLASCASAAPFPGCGCSMLWQEEHSQRTLSRLI